MRQILCASSDRWASPVNDLKESNIWVLIGVCVTLSLSSHASLAQQSVDACRYYDAQCKGGATSPICAQLKRRCGAAAGATSGGPAKQSQSGNATDMPQLDSPMELPDCTQDQEMVMVPTCQCATPGETGGVAGGGVAGDNACSNCTANGVRMECQPIR